MMMMCWIRLVILLQTVHERVRLFDCVVEWSSAAKLQMLIQQELEERGLSAELEAALHSQRNPNPSEGAASTHTSLPPTQVPSNRRF